MEDVSLKYIQYWAPSDENKIYHGYPLEESNTRGRESSGGGGIIVITQVRSNKALIYSNDNGKGETAKSSFIRGEVLITDWTWQMRGKKMLRLYYNILTCTKERC